MDVQKFNIFFPNFPQWGDFQPKFCIFGRKLSDMEKNSRRAKIQGGFSSPVLPPALCIFLAVTTLLSVSAAKTNAEQKTSLYRRNNDENCAYFLVPCSGLAQSYCRPNPERSSVPSCR